MNKEMKIQAALNELFKKIVSDNLAAICFAELEPKCDWLDTKKDESLARMISQNSALRQMNPNGIPDLKNLLKFVPKKSKTARALNERIFAIKTKSPYWKIALY